MKNFLSVILIFLLFLSGCDIQNNNNQNENIENQSNNYTASKTSTMNNNIQNTNDENQNNGNNNDKNKEEDLSSFSTKIYTPNDEARQNNISLTCSKLNGTIVKSGETFSFCNTVGKATPEAGYKKADIFDKDGNTKKGYGGGNCQISSTLYNAVLALPNLSVIERHEHSKKVYYVPKGKDAAVAYGSIDFKFRNDYDYDIKIYASSTKNTIDIRIVKI